MTQKRTDLAVEARELWQESAPRTTKLEGVEASEKKVNGFSVETVRVLDECGEKNLGKPKGMYMTVNLEGLARKEEGSFSRAVKAVSSELKELLDMSKYDSILVTGLGNSAITPDNLGPKTIKYTMVTRHLVERVPEHFASFRKVSALQAGVLGVTGIESAELIRAVVEEIKPDIIIAVDALASRKLTRVCRTIQITDTGIIPGSGVGNSRAALCKQSLGVPVVAIGVPTVVDAGTLAADLMERSGLGEISPDIFGDYGRDMIVTLKDIDMYIDDISKLIGYSINMALHDNITEEDITMFLS